MLARSESPTQKNTHTLALTHTHKNKHKICRSHSLQLSPWCKRDHLHETSTPCPQVNAFVTALVHSMKHEKCMRSVMSTQNTSIAAQMWLLIMTLVQAWPRNRRTFFARTGCPQKTSVQLHGQPRKRQKNWKCGTTVSWKNTAVLCTMEVIPMTWMSCCMTTFSAVRRMGLMQKKTTTMIASMLIVLLISFVPTRTGACKMPRTSAERGRPSWSIVFVTRFPTDGAS